MTAAIVGWLALAVFMFFIGLFLGHTGEAYILPTRKKIVLYRCESCKATHEKQDEQ